MIPQLTNDAPPSISNSTKFYFFVGIALLGTSFGLHVIGFSPKSPLFLATTFFGGLNIIKSLFDFWCGPGIPYTDNNFPIARHADPEMATCELSNTEHAEEKRLLATSAPSMVCQTTRCYGSVPIRDVTRHAPPSNIPMPKNNLAAGK